GDGAADIVNTLKPGGSDSRAVWLATATGWVQDAGDTAALQNSTAASFDGTNNLGLSPTDYDNDGLIDLMQGGAGIQQAYHNTGTGWVADAAETAVMVAAESTFVESDGTPSGYALQDVD